MILKVLPGLALCDGTRSRNRPLGVRRTPLGRSAVHDIKARLSSLQPQAITSPIPLDPMRDRDRLGHSAQRRLHAIQTLSQLSYSPTVSCSIRALECANRESSTVNLPPPRTWIQATALGQTITAHKIRSISVRVITCDYSPDRRRTTYPHRGSRATSPRSPATFARPTLARTESLSSDKEAIPPTGSHSQLDSGIPRRNTADTHPAVPPVGFPFGREAG